MRSKRPRGATSRIDAPAIPPPQGLEVATVTLDGSERYILSFPLREPRWPASLTDAEREVAAMLLEGASNAAIAERRGTSERTVVNQVASIFRKAGVGSRVELAARAFGE